MTWEFMPMELKEVKELSRYKYWSTNKLFTLLKELELSLSGSHSKDVYLKHHVENILYKRGELNEYRF